MRIVAGLRLRSQACSTEVVVRVPTDKTCLRCAGPTVVTLGIEILDVSTSVEHDADYGIG